MELQTTSNQISVQSTVFSGTSLNSPSHNRDNSKDVSQRSTSDTVSISPQARQKSTSSSETTYRSDTTENESSVELTQEELAELTELKARDTEVRAHEQAHLAAAGGHATGGPSFTLQKGPDGQAYAVGGEVGIDLSAESDPSATIQKMQTVQRAAMAPASPSSTDRQVAAQASVKENQARQELLKEQQEILLDGEQESTSIQPDSGSYDTNPSGPSISSLKASLAVYEQMSTLQ